MRKLRVNLPNRVDARASSDPYQAVVKLQLRDPSLWASECLGRARM